MISELEIREVLNPGAPNTECVLIKPLQTVDIAPFAMCVGLRGANGGITPVRDAFFWFGEGAVQPDDWIFLFSGSGKASREPIPDEAGHCICIYWGRPITLFHDNIFTPFLIRLDSLSILQPPKALPQL
jgi:hypothetical protein